jgi:hypothetical protein
METLGTGGLGERARVAAVLCVAALLTLGGAPGAGAAMTSKKLAPKLCVTTGGGKFVRAPGFPGETIDRRLKTDLAFLRRRYKIFLTDGHSLDPVHSSNGEHPIGLAMDIVPDKSAGGRWRDISRLARFAEPSQDAPRQPFRWVGYNGDSGHGKGHHLHLSYSHSKTRYNKPARTVYTLKCPRRAADQPEEPGGGKGGGGEPSGGIGARALAAEPFGQLAPVVPESGGISAP